MTYTGIQCFSRVLCTNIFKDFVRMLRPPPWILRSRNLEQRSCLSNPNFKKNVLKSKVLEYTGYLKWKFFENCAFTLSLFAAAQRPEQEDARSSRAEAKYENPQASAVGLSLRAQQRSGSSASNASDEDTDGDHKSGSRTQSRIDKWKAKHEAMLKMASTDKKKAAAAEAASASSPSSQDKASASSEDETSTEIKANGVCISLNKPSPASLQAPPALSVK